MKVLHIFPNEMKSGDAILIRNSRWDGGGTRLETIDYIEPDNVGIGWTAKTYEGSTLSLSGIVRHDIMRSA